MAVRQMDPPAIGRLLLEHKPSVLVTLAVAALDGIPQVEIDSLGDAIQVFHGVSLLRLMKRDSKTLMTGHHRG